MNNKKVMAITKIQFLENFRISVIFLIFYAAALAIITGVLSVTGHSLDLFYQVDTFVIATKLFLIILGGVTFYSTFKDYIMQGTTRKEFAVGSLSAIFILCIFFTLVLTAVYFVVQIAKNATVDTGDTTLLLLASLLLFYAYYIIGWFMGMAYLKYGVFGQLVSCIFSIVAIALMEMTTNIGFSNLVEGTQVVSLTAIPLIYNLLSTVIISFLITYYVYFKAKKIYIRVE